MLEDADLFPLGAGDDPDGACQLVFDGDAGLEEGDDDLLGAGGEGGAEVDLGGPLAAVLGRQDAAGLDAESLLGLAGREAVALGLDEVQADAVPPLAANSRSLLTRSLRSCTYSRGTRRAEDMPG